MNSESLSTRQVLVQDYCHHDALVTLQIWSNEKETGIRVSTLVVLSNGNPTPHHLASAAVLLQRSVMMSQLVQKILSLATVKVDNKLDDKC